MSRPRGGKMDGKVTKGMGRREFVGAAAAALFAGVSITLVGCSEDEPTAPAKGDVAGTINGNHGHSVTITKVQIEAGAGVTLTLSGGGHPHNITLTAEQVALVKSGAGVHDGVTTSTNGHTHSVMFM